MLASQNQGLKSSFLVGPLNWAATAELFHTGQSLTGLIEIVTVTVFPSENPSLVLY